MSSLLKNLLMRRGVLSLEDGAEGEEKKEPVGDGGSTPDGSEPDPAEIDPETPVEDVPPTEEVPSKSDEETTEEETPSEKGAEGTEETTTEEVPGATDGADPAAAVAEEQPEEVPNPDEGGAEPGSSEDEEETDEFDDDEDEDDFDEDDEEEFVETASELSEAQQADLAMVNLIVKVRDTLADGGLTGREAAMVADRAGAILGKVDMEPTPTPVQECFGSFGDRRTNTQLALEALQEDQKAVEQKKEGIIAKLMKFIREMWNALFGSKERFKGQVVAATQRVAKIDSKQAVVLKGSEGIVAAYAAMVGKDNFTCGELAMATDAIMADLRGVVAKFNTVAGNDELEDDMIENLVRSTKVLQRLGMSSDQYHEKTKEYSRHEITIHADPQQAATMVKKFESGYDAAENLMKDLDRVSKRAAAAGNAKQLTEVLTLVRMVTNLTKAGPLLAIRLASTGEPKAA